MYATNFSLATILRHTYYTRWLTVMSPVVHRLNIITKYQQRSRLRV